MKMGLNMNLKPMAREDFLDHLEDLKDSNASDDMIKGLQKQIDIQDEKQLVELPQEQET
jgi:hypothetical protein